MMRASVPIPVLILAAGSSTRFGDDKLLADIAGQPLLAWTLEAALDVVPADHLLVATAPAHGARRALCDVAGVATIVVPDAELGMGWTLHDSLQACPGEVPGAIVALADDPLTLRMLPMVLAAARRDPERTAAVHRDPFLPHPVYLPRSAWPGRPSAEEDHGLRRLLDDSTRWVEDGGVHPVDVDVPADLERLRAALATS